MTITESAIQHFGITYKISEAGYLLTNGKLLDLSGKNDGGPANTRSCDHREISICYESIDGTDAMIDFMNAGNIRL